ncbi:MAG TPA: hypothetical protein VGX92_04810 [Pyrinomonadaceae bacterium]|jgi:hypothetical protein|nr:hypothetical protein [Pyrinomonadaceae bacterium]
MSESNGGAANADNRDGDGLHIKDAVLDKVSEVANVAQFVSFDPSLGQRYARIRDHAPNRMFRGVEDAVRALLASAPDNSVNVRSFTPENPKSREFIYGLRNVDEAAAAVRRLGGAGLYTIVNETVDVQDGGVSGVALGDVIEMAPGDTPRCVEKEGTVSFERALGMRLLERVYHFRPALDYGPGTRVEFSLHPLRRGFRHDHTIVWELEEVGPSQSSAETSWPNRFSRFIGDKAFGLLVADALGLPVPMTTVFARSLPPFSFGKQTGTGETWIRTCPVVQDPGHFTTQRGWCDPFKLLADEDPDGTQIASILAQEGIDASFSGSLIVQADGELKIEGTEGYGDKFMLGQVELAALPAEVTDGIRRLYEQARGRLGPVRMEWVRDKSGATWIVQIHRGITQSQGAVVFKGEASVYHRFDVARGIDELRELIARVRGTGEGIILVGNVGVTSHLGDLLRKAEIASRIEPKKPV